FSAYRARTAAPRNVGATLIAASAAWRAALHFARASRAVRSLHPPTRRCGRKQPTTARPVRLAAHPKLSLVHSQYADDDAGGPDPGRGRRMADLRHHSRPTLARPHRPG